MALNQKTGPSFLARWALSAAAMLCALGCATVSSAAPTPTLFAHVNDNTGFMTVDSADNLYVGTDCGTALYRFTPTAAQSTVVANSCPESATVAADGTIYYVNLDNNLYRSTDGGAHFSVFGTLEAGGHGKGVKIVIAPSGDIYVTDDGPTPGTIVHFAAAGGAGTVFAANPGGAHGSIGLVMDSSGTLYSSTFNGRIYKITSGGVATVLSTAVSQPEDLALDGSGNLFAIDASTGNIDQIDKTTGTATVFAANPDGGDAEGLVFDNAGNLFTSNQDTGNIYEFGLAPVPTLGEWAMVGFGLLIAASGVLAITRRRRPSLLRG